MKRTLSVFALAMVAALVLCLTGCGSSNSSGGSTSSKNSVESSSSTESTITVTRQGMESETFSGNEFSKSVNDNEAFGDKYIAAEIDTTAQVSKVENGVIYNNHKTDGGYIILDNGVCVEYSKDDLDMVSDLKKGDVVHAKGVIFYIDSQGIKVMNNDTNYHFPSGHVLSPQKATIEKL